MPHKLAYQSALIVLLGVIVLFIRNPDPVLNPALFGEDGTWLIGFLTHDLQAAYFGTRLDYLTFGQSAILNAAVFLNQVFFGDSIAHLPQIMAGLSYLFWASVAATAFAGLRPWLRAEWRVAVVAIIFLMPLGVHSNEVLGRILNLGFMFFPLAVFLILLRPQVRFEGWKYFIDMLLLVCCATNPLCIALVGGHALLSAISTYRRDRSIPVRDLVVGCGIGLLCLFYLYRFGDAPKVGMEELNPSRLVEAIFARSLLYPFIFPVYQGLSDAWSLALFLALAALMGWALVRAEASGKMVGFGLATATAIVVLGTIATRYSLTAHLHGYTSTFPDRYYYAQNVMIVVCMAWAMSRTPARVSISTFLLLGVIYAGGSQHLFNFGSPDLPISEAGNLQTSAARVIEQAGDIHPAQVLAIPTYPHGWYTQAPAYVVEATATDARRAPSLEQRPGGLNFVDALAMIAPLAGLIILPLAAGLLRRPRHKNHAQLRDTNRKV
jgi:hypothetical protein